MEGQATPSMTTYLSQPLADLSNIPPLSNLGGTVRISPGMNRILTCCPMYDRSGIASTKQEKLAQMTDRGPPSCWRPTRDTRPSPTLCSTHYCSVLGSSKPHPRPSLSILPCQLRPRPRHSWLSSRTKIAGSYRRNESSWGRGGGRGPGRAGLACLVEKQGGGSDSRQGLFIR